MRSPVVGDLVLPELGDGFGVVLQPGQRPLLLHSVHEPGPLDLPVIQ